MGNLTDPIFRDARSGSRIVSQYQRGGNGAVVKADALPALSYAARFKPVQCAPGDWTAVTTGYPDATELGNITLYQADVGHDLGNTRALVVGMQDIDGLDISSLIQFANSDDPSNPGNLHANSIRIWISQDSAPAADIYVMVLG